MSTTDRTRYASDPQSLCTGRQCEGVHMHYDHECGAQVMAIVLDGSDPAGRAFCVAHLIEHYQHQDDSYAAAARCDRTGVVELHRP